MTMRTTLLLLLAAAIIAYGFKKLYDHLLYHSRSRKLGCTAPPRYPHRDPILGYDLFKLTTQSIQDGDSFPVEQRLFQEHGMTFKVNQWGSTAIWTMDPQNLQVVLSQTKNFIVAPLREGLLKPFMERSVFTADGPEWAHSRAAIKPIFQRAQVTDLAPFAVHVGRFLDLLPRDGSTVDLQPLLKRMVSFERR